MSKNKEIKRVNRTVIDLAASSFILVQQKQDTIILTFRGKESGINLMTER